MKPMKKIYEIYDKNSYFLLNLEDPKQTPPPFSIGTRHWWHHVQGLTEPGSWCHWGTPSYHPFVGFFHESPGTPLCIYRVYDGFIEFMMILRKSAFFMFALFVQGVSAFAKPPKVASLCFNPYTVWHATTLQDFVCTPDRWD